ncbi:hypothetical protein L6164_014729 [Bauhinia variegata]|uniref:Uncharacterized protein n=1 Tax=Bauhinia variegata TaxID=167791 RepID=A0ACB9NJP3_BAUVA|nr:hypothetical protein L6164_014729 [Bauhinia variegata]
MSNGEGTREATSEVASPDQFDSFNSLRLRQSDGADASLPSSRYSSCGESEFERYCSANSVMGTPSICSTITVYNDFGFEDDSGLENFSLGERALISPRDLKLSTSDVFDNSKRVFSSGIRRENNLNQQNLKYGSSGLELYGDDNDDLTMTMLDTSSLMGINQIHEHLRQDFVQKDHVEEHNELGGQRDDVENHSSDVNDDAGTMERYLLGDVDRKCPQSVQATGGEDEIYGFDTQSSLQNVEREIEREQDGNSSNFEHSEGEDSIYNYGSDNDIKTEFHLARNIHYHQESKVRNENPLLMNSSTAFGAEDLDDLLLENEQNAQASQMFNAFRNQTEKNPEIEDNRTKLSYVNSMKFSSPGQKDGGKDTKETVIGSQKVEEKKDLGEQEEIKEVRDTPAAQGANKLANIIESSSDASTYFPKIVKPQHEDVREIYVAKTQVQRGDKLVTCPKRFSITKPYEVDQDPLAEEAPLVMGLNVNDDGTIEEGHLHTNTEKPTGASDAQHVDDNLVLNNSKLNLDLFSDGAVNQNCSLSAEHIGKINTEPFENLEQDEPSATFERRKTLESSSASENLFEKAPVTTEVCD